MQLIMEPQNLRATFGVLRATLACLRAISDLLRAKIKHFRAIIKIFNKNDKKVSSLSLRKLTPYIAAYKNACW